MIQTLTPPPVIEAVSYIRWSSDKQGDGTSLPRQRKVTRGGAAAMGWPITREIRDEGVSAFFGTNLEDGQLGEFIRQCEREGGHGKALIVEMISRISRLNAFDAVMNIGRMVNTGLTLMLADQMMVIDAGSIRNQRAQLESIVAQAEKAHREVDDKTRMVRLAWEIMREEGRPVHCKSTCPAWLEMDAGRTRFLPLHEMGATALHRVAVVNEILDLYIAGWGCARIAKMLNERGEPTFRRGAGWRGSSVKAIVHNRALIGEYQHHVRREPTGQIVPDYFPAIVSNDKFQLANDAAHRRVMASHSHSTKVQNLFSETARCAACDGRMEFVNKSRLDANGKPWTYLQCDGYRRKRGCASKKMVRYAPIERAVLDVFLERALDDQHFQVGEEVAVIRRRVADQQREIDDANRTIQNIAGSIASFEGVPAAKRAMEGQMVSAATNLDAATTRMEDLQRELDRAAGKASRSEHIRRVADIRGDLGSDDKDKAAQAGKLVKMALNDIVKSIQFDVRRSRFTVTLVSGMGFAIGSFDGRLSFLDTVKDWKEPSYYAGEVEPSKAVGRYLDRRAELHGA